MASHTPSRPATGLLARKNDRKGVRVLYCAISCQWRYQQRYQVSVSVRVDLEQLVEVIVKHFKWGMCVTQDLMVVTQICFNRKHQWGPKRPSKRKTQKARLLDVVEVKPAMLLR